MHAMHHTLLGFCGWDLPALIILIALIVVLVVRHNKLKKTEQELEDLLSGADIDEASEEKDAAK